MFWLKNVDGEDDIAHEGAAPEVTFQSDNLKSLRDFLASVGSNKLEKRKASLKLELMHHMLAMCEVYQDHKKDFSIHLKTRQSLNARWFYNISKFTPVRELVDPATNALIIRRNILLRCPTGNLAAFLRITAVLRKNGTKYYPEESIKLSVSNSLVFKIHATRVKYTDFSEGSMEEFPTDRGQLFFVITDIDIETDIVGMLDLQD